MKTRSHKIAGLLASAALAGTGLAVVTAPPAEAAKQAVFMHHAHSEKQNMLVYHGYTCRNNAETDFVPKGDFAHIDVGAVWVVKGVSLWQYDVEGKREWTRVAKKSSKSRCVTLINYANRVRLWVFRNGNNWGRG